MNKKFLIGLAPLLVTAAFVVMPAVSQGAFETCTAPNCPHVYKNGVVGTANVKVRGIAWGNLKLHNEKLNDVECHNIFGGFAVNPAGGGAATGEAQAFYPYECVSQLCKVKGEGTVTVTSGKTLPWRTEVFEPKAGEFWEKIGFKGPTPNAKATEPGQTEFHWGCSTVTDADFFGEFDAKILNNGISTAAPGELQPFRESQNPNAHNLESELLGPGEFESGTLKVMGYAGQELIEVKSP